MNRPRNAMDIQLDYRGRAFAIDLKSQDFWLVLEKKYQPLGIVMGHCVYSMGSLRHLIINIQGVFHGEIKRHLAIARQLALARIQFQADQLGADGIISTDVKIELTHNNEWLEVCIIGTAVRYIGEDLNTSSVEQ
jgi:uncharacterized protein YbjQ (UPF0145 family)